MQRYIAAKVINPRLRRKDEPVSRAILRAADLLANKAEIDPWGPEFLGCVRALSDSVANSFSLSGYDMVFPTPTWFDTKITDSPPPPGDDLTAAVVFGNVDIVRTVLTNGANPNTRSRFFGYPLQNAARLGQTEIMELLVAHHGTDPKLEEICDISLVAAAFAGRDEAIHFLLNEPHVIFTWRQSYQVAVLAAAHHGHLDVLKLLIDKTPSRNSINNKETLREKALLQACEWGHLPLVKYLIENGASPIVVQPSMGLIPPYYATLRGHLKVVNYLHDIMVRSHGSIRWEPLALVIAVIADQKALVEHFLDQGAHHEFTDTDRGIFDFQVEHRNMSMIRLLLRRGMDWMSASDGSKLLNLADGQIVTKEFSEELFNIRKRYDYEAEEVDNMTWDWPTRIGFAGRLLHIQGHLKPRSWCSHARFSMVSKVTYK